MGGGVIFITTPEGHVRVHIVAKINLISVRHRIISTNPPYVLARSFAQLLSGGGVTLRRIEGI